MSDHSELTKRLVAEGLAPVTVPGSTAELRQRLHAAAMHVLNIGAPGLTETSRNALASAIALR